MSQPVATAQKIEKESNTKKVAKGVAIIVLIIIICLCLYALVSSYTSGGLLQDYFVFRMFGSVLDLLVSLFTGLFSLVK